MKCLLLGMFCVWNALFMGFWDSLTRGSISYGKGLQLQFLVIIGILLMMLSFLLESDRFVKWIGGKNGTL